MLVSCVRNGLIGAAVGVAVAVLAKKKSPSVSGSSPASPSLLSPQTPAPDSRNNTTAPAVASRTLQPNLPLPADVVRTFETWNELGDLLTDEEVATVARGLERLCCMEAMLQLRRGKGYYDFVAEQLSRRMTLVLAQTQQRIAKLQPPAHALDAIGKLKQTIDALVFNIRQEVSLSFHRGQAPSA